MTYRDDPEWQKARAEFMRDTAADETPTDAMFRRMAAAYALRDIEARYEAVAA